MNADNGYGNQLFTDVEPWMDAPLLAWLTGQLQWVSGGAYQRRTDWTQEFDSRMRRTSPMTSTFLQNGVGAVISNLKSFGGYIDFLDFLVMNLADEESDDWDEEAVEELDFILAAAGSAWKVGTRENNAGLERRVPLGVQDAANAAMAVPGDAGRLLSEAWHAAFGRNPQADLAYRKSIEAVEAAVLPSVIANDTSGHLGKAISQMRTDCDWTLPFIKEHTQNPTGAVVINMMQALWSGHSDRHPGTSNYVQSTPEAAEAAVFLAVPLVAWFTSGAVARRP